MKVYNSPFIQSSPTPSSFVDDDVGVYQTDGTQWEAYSDGGCRGEGVSAFAWILYAVLPVGETRHRFTVAFGYEALQNVLSRW